MLKRYLGPLGEKQYRMKRVKMNVVSLTSPLQIAVNQKQTGHRHSDPNHYNERNSLIL